MSDFHWPKLQFTFWDTPEGNINNCSPRLLYIMPSSNRSSSQLTPPVFSPIFFCRTTFKLKFDDICDYNLLECAIEFFQNEFSDKNICHYSNRTLTCHLLCKRPGCYHSTSRTHVRDRIFICFSNSSDSLNSLN